MFRFAFLQRLFQPWQAKQESIRLFPLPCPIHGNALVPEPCGNGEWIHYCPHCRIACQPVVMPTQSRQEDAQTRQSTGAVLHTHLAKKRMIERLKSTRLVLMPTDLNSKPGDTDSLEFGSAMTEVTLPRMPKALPDVG